MSSTAEARAREVLERIESAQPTLGAFITVTSELAIKDARAVESRHSGSRIAGLLLAVKDNVDVASVVTTVGSPAFRNRVAKHDADAVKRLRATGAVVVGKAFLHELAFGHMCDSPVFGTCRNAWDTDRVPGGSSGGSAVAVAAGLCDAAIGTDTGGSIRVPAALNGVAGLRPTMGTIRTGGLFPLCPTFDTIGPMARRVERLSTLLAAMGGVTDATTPGRSTQHVRIGVWRPFFFETSDSEVVGVVEAALRVLEMLGAELVELDKSGAEEAATTFARLQRAEAAQELGDVVTEFFDEIEVETRTRVLEGSAIAHEEVRELQESRHHWVRTLERLFHESVDIIATPTTPTVAPVRAESSAASLGVLGRFTHALSLARLPALSIPAGFAPNGLPVGLHLAAPPYGEPLLLKLGEAFQQATEWHCFQPKGYLGESR